MLILGYFVSSNLSDKQSVEISIAVLPFRNDSPSDSNTYFINGVMEEILNNLQKIKDLRIVSRMFSTIKTEPEFLQVLDVMTKKYSKVHEDVGKWLEQQEGY